MRGCRVVDCGFCKALGLPVLAPDPLVARLKVLGEARQVMLTYIKLKIEENDLHAAIDGLMDLREFDTEMRVLRELKETN